jgi:hypothetical protein
MYLIQQLATLQIQILKRYFFFDEVKELQLQKNYHTIWVTLVGDTITKKHCQPYVQYGDV